MSKLKIVTLLLYTTILFGCGGNNQSSLASSMINSSSVPSESSDVSSLISSGELSSTEIKYQKDEEGFYILEEDYFHIDEDPNTQMLYTSEQDDVKYANNYRLYYGDVEIPVYGCNSNPGRTWVANPTIFIEVGVGVINLKGKGVFKLQTNFAFKDTTSISPLASNVKHEFDLNRRVITFEINECGQYSFSFVKNMGFHLFVNPIEDEKIPEGTTNIVRFEKGVHTKKNNKLIGSDNMINLKSNTTVILDRGAIVEAGFSSVSTNNVHIIGDGIVLGSHFERNPNTGAKLIPYDFSYCSNLSIEGITTLDPAGWCYNIYFCTNVILDNVKIISSRSNGDGVSVQSCKNFQCTRSFVRSWDDSLVVKNYKNWKYGGLGSTANVSFSKCQIWTDLAQCMEIGYETVGEELTDVSFKDITVLFAYHKPVISIHNSNNARVRNISYERITVECAKMGLGDGNNYLIDFNNNYSSTWSDQYGSFELGNIEKVSINNVVILNGNNDCKVKIAGCKDTRQGYDHDEEHYIKDVSLNNVVIMNNILTESSPNLLIGEYVYNVTISSIGDIKFADPSF